MLFTPRLRKIIDLCVKTRVIADIGTDHGHTCAGVLERGLAEKGIASDISEKSLEKAKCFFYAAGLAGRTDCRLGDGLSVLNEGEAGGIVISGMGAPLMVSLLEKGLRVARSAAYLILSPHTYPERLRRFLIAAGFLIEVEDMAREGGKFYPILRAAPGSSAPYSLQELLLGRYVRPTAEWRCYLACKVSQYRRIAARVKTGARAAEVRAWLSVFEKVQKEWEEWGCNT